MIKVHPIRLSGNWFEGFALDSYISGTIFLGFDDFGHPDYDTQRSALGELLFRLKYRSDRSALKEILDVTVDHLNNKWKIAKDLHGIVPVPPADTDRDFQPVMEIARGLGSRIKIPVYEDALLKIKQTPQLKDIYRAPQRRVESLKGALASKKPSAKDRRDPGYQYQKRLELLKQAFVPKDLSIEGKNMLLFDDLYSSGTTLNAATDVLYGGSMVNRVYALTLTKTRSTS